MAKVASNHQQRLDELHEKFAALGLVGYWQRQRQHHNVEPRLWRWEEVHPALMQAADVVRIGPEAFRRNIGLETESHTIVMGFQIVLPGEAAPAHRHTNTALRFVVKGGGAYTTSNGEPMTMQPGDLLIQPNWVWHDHVNEYQGTHHLDRRPRRRGRQFPRRLPISGRVVRRGPAAPDAEGRGVTPPLRPDPGAGGARTREPACPTTTNGTKLSRH